MAEGPGPRLKVAGLEESVAAMEITVLEAVDPAEGVPLAIMLKERPVVGLGPMASQEGLEAG